MGSVLSNNIRARIALQRARINFANIYHYFLPRVLHASGEVRNIGAEIEQGGEGEGDQNRHEDNHRFHVFFLMSLVR
jgi:hypothetical protein